MARKPDVKEGPCDLWWPEQSSAHGCLPVIAMGLLVIAIGLLGVL